ncbi:hypothetical protein ABH917_000483 [Thermobifida halotolerans]
MRALIGHFLLPVSRTTSASRQACERQKYVRAQQEVSGSLPEAAAVPLWITTTTQNGPGATATNHPPGPRIEEGLLWTTPFPTPPVCRTPVLPTRPSAAPNRSAPAVFADRVRPPGLAVAPRGGGPFTRSPGAEATRPLDRGQPLLLGFPAPGQRGGRPPAVRPFSPPIPAVVEGDGGAVAKSARVGGGVRYQACPRRRDGCLRKRGPERDAGGQKPFRGTGRTGTGQHAPWLK